MEGKAVIGETDMLHSMQEHALRLAGKALDDFDVTDSTEIARCIKKEFDRVYGPGWQCIVGTDFGSFVTHCHGCFIYFSIGSLAILLFRGVACDSDADLISSLDSDSSSVSSIEVVKA
ncbi:hypothetical protein ACLOJK_020567 [Asimina triloba]